MVDTVHDIGYKDIVIGDKCDVTGSQLRPHIVWFGEMPFNVEESATALQDADIVLIIGTSLQIGYTIPVLGLGAANATDVYYIDPKPAHYLDEYGLPITYIEKKAVEGVSDLVEILMNREDE